MQLRRFCERYFRLSENRTSIRTELTAGLTTFLTMAYIIFVQPSVLSGVMFGQSTGMDFGALTTATCITAALATAIMALYARYPIALAPGMGENFFFVFTAIPAAAAAGSAIPWQTALGAVFISGIVFMAISLAGARELLLNAVSPSLKNGIAVGIGFFIAFIGLRNAGLIIPDAGTMVRLNPNFASLDLLVFFAGFITTSVLFARGVKGAILWGIAAAAALALGLHWLAPHLPGSLAQTPAVRDSLLLQRFEPARRLFSSPPSMAPIFLKIDLRGALSSAMLPMIVIFLFMDVFDTMGTLIGVSGRAGLIRNNRLPRAERAFMADAIGTVAGAGCGMSTVTCFVESAAGVEHGGRTGLTSLTAAGLFLLAPFFAPVIAMIGSFPPITAPALVIVGFMMMQNIRQIAWEDYSESVPAGLIMIGIPLCYSIADGLALGFIAYPAIKLLSGRRRESSWVLYAVGLILLVYFITIRR